VGRVSANHISDEAYFAGTALLVHDDGLEIVATDTGRMLDQFVDFVRRYVVLSEAQLVAASLWIAHTHAFEAADATPYLSITSAEKESGKTRLLEVLDLLVARPWYTGRVSAAVLARKVDAETPTLLLDESDATFNGEKEYAETLRGMLNTGHRKGGCSSLCVGQGAALTYTDLSTFCPKAVAGIGELPDTVASRAIAIRLKRKAPGERVERYRRRDAEEAADPLREWLRSWGESHVDLLAEARPHLPDELGDRAQDSWEPLLAIADLAGGDWAARGRRAALELSDTHRDEGSIDVRLLADIRCVFDERGVDRLATAELLDGLAADEEAPWGSWHRGEKPMSARALADRLRPFDVHSKTIRLPSGETPKGFTRDQFEDVWARYLPRTPDSSATTPQPAPVRGLGRGGWVAETPLVADTKEAANPHGSSDVADVADRSRGEGLPAGEDAFLAEVEKAIAKGILVPLNEEPELER
jgi:hypothetical protein